MRDRDAHLRLQALLRGTAMEAMAEYASDKYLYSRKHGLTDRWLDMFDALPDVVAGSIDLKTGVRIGSASDCTPEQLAAIDAAARSQIPWRKGPWSVFGVEIDSEWRSDMKWDRLLPHIESLQGRRVLDVGSGNAYHCYRALGEGARYVLGVDPHLAYFFQFRFIQHFLRQYPVFVLPVTLDEFPDAVAQFDTVFSMGVLYHRKSPLDHLFQLLGCLRSGGQLILETLVVDGPEGYALTPPDRYCRMNNVWFLPSVATTESWLRRCGFRNVRTVDINVTGAEEQRTTPWMPFQSLIDGLDPYDQSLSIEGLPGPKRALIIAEAP
ncbi:MAG: tRNA 5-methoxyuridine(34)/uridine 5-oxyacetic acid(34) synthase CmoB [Pseudohongiella sp.]|nr:tRNA 5-methoxyuridine(34)/uridine 5-oxyacetic acid(34) synthase CmoB [Pseudohongiella sp.]